MNSKLTQPWVPLERIEDMIQVEPALVILGLSISAWLGYKLLLRKVQPHRHKNLQGLFKNLAIHLLIGSALFGTYLTVHKSIDVAVYERLAAYLGLATIFWGAVIFVKVARIFVFEYLFLSHMRVAVPLLLVNLSALLLSICLGAWIITEIFSIRLAPLLATSAIFSVVLGLALQDTLGNLFAGVALQFDKPYEIGDWVEIETGGAAKWIGQVHDISWRATVLIGLSDETITVPNRVMSQAQIANFATRHRPIVRRQTFRIPYGAPIEQAKSTLIRAASRVREVRRDPSPKAVAVESHESWITLRLIYFVDDYGTQHLVGDSVISECLEALKQANIGLASPRLDIAGCNSSQSA